jgi:hypothetical protein
MRCRHYERALRTIIANPTKAAEYAQSALDMGTARNGLLGRVQN